MRVRRRICNFSGATTASLGQRVSPAPFGRTVQVGDDLMVDMSEFDCLTGRMVSDRVVLRDGQARRSRFFVRFPTIPELRAWLADAGFAASEFRARAGGPPTIDRPRMVVLATASARRPDDGVAAGDFGSKEPLGLRH